jgi:hypothetical protein
MNLLLTWLNKGVGDPKTGHVENVCSLDFVTSFRNAFLVKCQTKEFYLFQSVRFSLSSK